MKIEAGFTLDATSCIASGRATARRMVAPPKAKQAFSAKARNKVTKENKR